MSKQFEAITIPKWGIEMTHGRVVSWCFAEGDSVAVGSALVEIETDKIVNSFEARVAGSVARILVREGDELPVGTLIGVLALGDYEPAELNAFIEEYASVGPEAPQDGTPAHPTGDTQAEKTTEANISPALRRKLDRAGIAVTAVRGSGSGGRIVKADIDRAIAEAGTSPSDGVVEQSRAGPESAPLSPTQARVAQRLTEAQNAVPLFHIQRRVEVGDALTGIRNRHPQLGSAVNVLLLRGIGVALTRHPELNLQYDNDLRHPVPGASVALAVARDDGAVSAPVITDITAKSPVELGDELVALVARARRGELTADDQQRSAITLSNLGSYGVDAFTAMVSPPQVMVLSVGAVQVRPVWRPDTQAFEPRECLDLTLGCDHRLINGAQGAEFLQTVAAFFSEPEL